MTTITAAPPSGAGIEVFSRSQGGWIPGKIESVSGNEATVVYHPPGVDASKAMRKVVDWPDGQQVRYPAGAPVPAPAAGGGGDGPLTRMMATGTTAQAGAAPAASAAAPATAPIDAGGTGLQPTVRVGNSVEVYSDVMGKWVPGVILSKSGSKVRVSYSTEVDLNVRSTSLREMGSGSAKGEVTAASTQAAGGDENAHKIGATGPQSVIDALPPLQKGIRYHQVRKQGGMGRKGANEYMFISAGRMGIHLYHMTDGSHFKTYAYEDLKSWEAGQTVLLLEKRKEKGGAIGPNVKTVEYETKPGEAMQIVEAIMRQVNDLVKSVREAAEAAGVEKKERSGSSLTKSYVVKKAGGRGRGKSMKLSCGQMGVQLMKDGEHYKTYAYKDLEEWATVSSTGSSDDSTHNRLILAKRDRNGMTTEYITEPGDATKIAHDITRKATELAKAMRAAKKGKKSYDEAAASRKKKAEEMSQQSGEATRVAESGGEQQAAETAAEPAEEPEPEPEVPKHSWTVETRCEVYSRSLKSWLPGRVLEVDDDEINVSYTDGAQQGTKWVDAFDPAAVRVPEKSEEDALAALQSVREAKHAEKQAAELREESAWSAEMARQKAAFAGKTEPKVGQKGTVFSRSAGQWLKCVVVAVGGDEARVKYKLQGQIGEKYVYWGDETEFKLGSGEAAANIVTTTIELVKGPAGYGMEVTDSCHVTGFAGDESVAKAAGVPVPSRIVEVGGIAVSTKQQLGQALVKAAGTGGGVPFVFLTKRTAVAAAPIGISSHSDAEEGIPPLTEQHDAQYDEGPGAAPDPFYEVMDYMEEDV